MIRNLKYNYFLGGGAKNTPKSSFKKREFNISLKETNKKQIHIKDVETGKYGIKTNFIVDTC